MVLYLLIIAGTMLYKYCGVLPSLRVERDAWDARLQARDRFAVGRELFSWVADYILSRSG